MRRWCTAPAEAMELYRRAIVVDPQNARAYLNLGFELQKVGEREASEAAFARAVALHPTLARRLPKP